MPVERPGGLPEDQPVTIPIKVFPATDAGATLSFNQLHAECQTRIQQKRGVRNASGGAEHRPVKGYEFEKAVRRRRRTSTR
jgi:non-homologous end joining protein Ku